MDEGFQLVSSPLLSNFTTQIKGWVGPIVKQRDHFPPNFAQVCIPLSPYECLAVLGVEVVWLCVVAVSVSASMWLCG